MEEGGLCMLAWKKRTGLGGSFVVNQKWERRWIVVSGNKMVYYSLGKEDAPTPRGVLDLVEQSATIHVPAKNAPDAPTAHELDIVANEEGESSAKVSWKLCFDSQQDQLHLLEMVHNILYQGGLYEEKDFDRFEHDLESGDHVFRWEMIIMPPVIYPIQIHGIVLEAGRNCVIIGDFGLTGYGKQEGADFNHAEDHNKSIMAAWKKLRPKEDQRLNIVSLIDPKEIRKWKKANYEDGFMANHAPKNKFGKSLSKFFGSTKSRSGDGESIRTDATVADEQGTRPRAGTADSGNSSVSGKLSKFFKSSKPDTISRQDSAMTDATVVDGGNEKGSSSEGTETSKETSSDSTKETRGVETEKQSGDTAEEEKSGKVGATNIDKEKGLQELSGDSEETPEVPSAEVKESTKNDENDRVNYRSEDELSDVPLSESEDQQNDVRGGEQDDASDEATAVVANGGGQLNEDKAVASQNGASSAASSPQKEAAAAAAAAAAVAAAQPAHEDLPKSDPKKIVLARAHFLLEYGEEILPPYHVFYSNSECIAVWCKTGRWSTLQTAVYLTGHSVGAAKSSTMATLGVAAAHAVFAPVVAVGGLIWVSAPMVILQKSRKKWEEATMKLTPLFWAWAPNEVFVEAIENWSDIR